MIAAAAAAAAAAANSRGLQSKKALRPRMSCNQCRFRKVKCDRIKPCSACCSRGKPTDCFFPVDASNKAIDQARQLRLLREENAELRALLEKRAAASRDCHSPPSVDDSNSKPVKRVNSSVQWRFKAEEPPDSLVYGCLSVQEIKHKLDQLESQPKHCRPVSLTHPALREVNTYAYQDAPADPFPTLWQPSLGPRSLLDILPSPEEIFSLLTVFDNQAQCFQYIPSKLATPEVECFLADLQNGAERNPQMLALVLAGMAHSVQLRRFQKEGEQWMPAVVERELIQADIYIAASMHALRLSSFMNRPTLLAVQILLLLGAYLVNTGKFLDAYSLYGLTIRVAQGMGLHQDPQCLNPAPSQKECDLRRNLWWRMLFIDQYYSMTLGRPLGISGVGNCLPSSQLAFCELGDNQKARRLEMYINQYTILSRQIISCDSLTNTKIDEFTDRLLQLQETLPTLVRFKASWLDEDDAPEWPLNFHAAVFHCNIHNYLILLNRKRQGSAAARDRPRKGSSGDDCPRPERGYETVISSCHEVLRAFFYLHKHLPVSLVHWSLGQQAFNAAMLLTLDMLERHPSDTADLKAVACAYDIFREMHEKSVCRPAKMAVERLKEVLDAVAASQNNHGNGSPQQQPQKQETETVMSNRGMILVEDPEIRATIGNGNAYYAPPGFRAADIELLPTPTSTPAASGSRTPETPGSARSAKRKRRGCEDDGAGERRPSKDIKLERSQSPSDNPTISPSVAGTGTGSAPHLRKLCPRVDVNNDTIIQQKAATNGPHPYPELQVPTPTTHEVPVPAVPTVPVSVPVSIGSYNYNNNNNYQYAASASTLYVQRQSSFAHDQQSVPVQPPVFNQQFISPHAYAYAGIY